MNSINLTNKIAATALSVAIVTGAAGAGSLQKDIAVALLEKGLMNGDVAFIKEHVAEGYIQHNPAAADRRDGLLGFVEYLKTVKPPLTVKPIRVLEEGDLVLVQSEYQFGGPKVIFDLFRFENGKIAEHWDAMQTPPEKTASGRSMIDGPIKITDVEKTQSNKKVAVGFVTDVLMNGKNEMAPNYIATAYAQHNPMISDDLKGLGDFMANLAKEKIEAHFLKIHKVVAEGNFVFTQSEGTFAGKPTAYYDLFRVEGGKLVEHWDVIQQVPDKMAHKNGMF